MNGLCAREEILKKFYEPKFLHFTVDITETANEINQLLKYAKHILKREFIVPNSKTGETELNAVVLS